VNIAILIPGGFSMRRETDMLAEQGHSCRRYAFVSTFIAGATREQFDLALVSWGLNGPRTVEIVQELRRICGRELPVVLLDPPASAADNEFLTRLGVDACYHQNRDPQEFKRCIARVISRAEGDEQQQDQPETLPSLLTLVS
jgi:DNA-binding response OmpR family regulator